MKKIILASGLFLMISFSFKGYDCYTDWLKAYDKATQDYYLSIERCQSAILQGRCQTESELYYDKLINQAADKYYDCVGYS